MMRGKSRDCASPAAAAWGAATPHGEERPVCIERNESCWAKNRRAHRLTKRP
jgi:hypothetical protein